MALVEKGTAFEGITSSPDTQRCKAMYLAALGVECMGSVHYDSSALINELERPPSISQASQKLNDPSLDEHVVGDRAQVKLGCPVNLCLPADGPAELGRQFVESFHARDSERNQPALLERPGLRTEIGTGDVARVSNSLAFICADGTKMIQQKFTGMAESISQLYGSDGSDRSNLSTTQEIDPSVYARLQEEISTEGFATTPSSGHVQSVADQYPPHHAELTATGTGVSYAADDTGHLTLDYQPQSPLQVRNYSDVEPDLPLRRPSLNQFNSEATDPRTPAQPKLVIGHPGTVMGLSQMFAQTQSSPGSRGRQLLPPSSSRPSPDIFVTHQSPSHINTSPLVRRDAILRAREAEPDIISSSPFASTQENRVSQSHEQIQPITVAVGIPPENALKMQLPASLACRIFPEPFDAYTSRKESQERRERQAMALDVGNQSSDDGFSDDDVQITLRAKLKKKEAARELAVVRVRRLGSTENAILQVPSTSARRRRSLEVECLAQCTDDDAEDTQPDDTIADSQTSQAVRPVATTVVETLAISHEIGGNASRMLCQSSPLSSVRLSSDQEDDMRSSTPLPGLDGKANSQATESYREYSEPAIERLAFQPLEELSTNIAELQTPDTEKKILNDDCNSLVPETSPLEAYQKRFGIIVRQSPPTASFQKADEVYDPFTQDSAFNAILKSPSPPKKRPSRRRRLPNIAASESIAVAEIQAESATVVHVHESGNASFQIKKSLMEEGSDKMSPSTVPGETSEYATAPTCPLSECNLPMEPESYVKMDEVQESYKENSSIIPTVETAEKGSQNYELANMPAPTPVPKQDSKHLKPRSANKTRGSSRAIRRLMKDSIDGSDSPDQNRITPDSTNRRTTRASRQASINSSDLASEKAKSTEPEGINKATVSKRTRTTTIKTENPGIFGGMAFSVTYIDGEDHQKQVVLRLIKQNGGQVLDDGFDELFQMAASDESSRNALRLTAEAGRIGFTCLITDKHSRRSKFMQALALGLPCLSGRWIQHCVASDKILDWEPYLLAAGESSFLGGAVRSRVLQPYPALTAKFADVFELRRKLLDGMSILLILGKDRANEQRKMAYLFLTYALGAKRVKRVYTHQEARNALLDAQNCNEEWDLVYVDADKEEATHHAIFGSAIPGRARKRKRGSDIFENNEGPFPKKIRIVSDEFVIQSLILGRLLEQ